MINDVAGTNILPAGAIGVIMSKTVLTALIFGLGLAAPICAQAGEVEVKMLNNASDGQRGFEPPLVRIRPGDSVHFVAVDKGHSVQSIPGMSPNGSAAFSGQTGQDVTVKFDKSGVYGYRCVPHYAMGMVGLVVVGAPLNEASARKVAHPRDAKARFDQLFSVLDHLEFASNRSEFKNVIDSKSLERVAGGKPLRTVPQPALNANRPAQD